MIVKILNKSSVDFNAVKYNDDKIEKEKGELMLRKNFLVPEDRSLTRAEIKNYLKARNSLNTRVKNPQFHATISAKGKEYSKEQLTDIAESYMEKMGYGEQPYIVVFHNDTDNNHIHIVSTRIDDEGKKINDSFEKLKSQEAIQKILEKKFKINVDEKLKDLVFKYSYQDLNQLSTLLKSNGFQVNFQSENYAVYQNGVKKMEILNSEIEFRKEKNIENIKKIRAIFYKYKEEKNNELIKIIDEKGKAKYTSEFSEYIKDKFGYEVVFHTSNDKTPFGYTLIDHSKKEVFKGSELFKLKDLFHLNEAESVIDKKLFDEINSYNIGDDNVKEAIALYFDVDSKFVFKNNIKIDKEDWKKEKLKLTKFLENNSVESLNNTEYRIVKNNDNSFILNTKNKYIFATSMLLNNDITIKINNSNIEKTYLSNGIINDAISVLGSAKNSNNNIQDAPKKKQQRRKRKR